VNSSGQLANSNWLLAPGDWLLDFRERALDALERDHQFLLKGDVFTEDLLTTYIEYKRTREVDAMRLRPYPYEFALYYDI
jgi:glutamine synthetase